MSDLVGNPEDWFSRVAAHIEIDILLFAEKDITFFSANEKQIT